MNPIRAKVIYMYFPKEHFIWLSTAVKKTFLF